MGRIHDTLHRAAAPAPASAPAVGPRLADASAEAPPAAWAIAKTPPRPTPAPAVVAEREEPAPFIEVGAPPPAPRSGRPAPDLRRAEPALFTISFRPLPAWMTGAVVSATGELAPTLVAYHRPDHAVALEYATLAREVEAQLGVAGPHAITLGSPCAGAGTTTVLLNLALTLARAGRKVLAVDARGRDAGSVAPLLGLEPRPGLAEWLGGGVPVQWATHPTAQAGLSALPAGDGPAPEAVPAQTQRAALLRRFDWVLVDAPLSALDAWAGWSEAAYLVLPESEFDAPAVAPLHARLVAASRLRGYVLTRPA